MLFSAGLFLLPAVSSKAGLNTVIKVDINCYFQAKVSASGGVDAGKVGIVRLSSKQLLNLIGREKGIRFPATTQLMADDRGNVYAANSDGDPIMDASPYIRLEFYKGSELLNGKVNVATGKEDSTSHYRLALKLKLTNLVGTLRGVAVENLLVTAPNKDGTQIARGNTDSSVNGKGRVNGGTGYYDGKINLKGRNAVVR
jgi:hypothetical protein